MSLCLPLRPRWFSRLVNVKNPGIVERHAIAALATAITNASGSMPESDPTSGTTKAMPTNHPAIIQRNALAYERFNECPKASCVSLGSWVINRVF